MGSINRSIDGALAASFLNFYLILWYGKIRSTTIIPFYCSTNV